MKLLCIDTTKQKAILALHNEGKNCFWEIPDTKRHSEALLFELEKFLCENKLTINEITNLGCVTGPGSFTGIRIGMATIKAFSFALNLPIVSADYFSIVSDSIKNGCAILKNTSSSFYFADITSGKFKSIDVVENSEIISMAKNKTIYVSETEQVLDEESYKSIEKIKDYNEIMLDYLLTLSVKGKFTKGGDFAPTYAQLSQAERNLKD